MLESLLLGSGFALAAAIQPGPLQAFLLSRVTATGWRRTLPACFAPVVSDGPIALLALLVLGQVSLRLQSLLQSAGGLLLIVLAWRTHREWRDPAPQVWRDDSPRTLLEAALVNLLNPNPYLGWALVLGPLARTAWSVQPAHAVALVVAFYATMVATMAVFVLLVGTARFLGPAGQRHLLAVSALLLLGLGLYLSGKGIFTLTLA